MPRLWHTSATKKGLEVTLCRKLDFVWSRTALSGPFCHAYSRCWEFGRWIFSGKNELFTQEFFTDLSAVGDSRCVSTGIQIQQQTGQVCVPKQRSSSIYGTCPSESMGSVFPDLTSFPLQLFPCMLHNIRWRAFQGLTSELLPEGGGITQTVMNTQVLEVLQCTARIGNRVNQKCSIYYK